MQKKFVLDSGPTLLIDSIEKSDAVSIGVWIDLGSRDEEEHEHGFAHFTEHMLFKGTNRRNYHDIALEIDAMGGEINGATGKENTYYFVNIASEYCESALDILIDMFFNARFLKDEFEKERRIILEEIDTSMDDPDDYVHDLFSSSLWGNGSFGLPVIGRKEEIQTASLKNLRTFYRAHYRVDRMIISAAGRINEQEFIGRTEDILARYMERGITRGFRNRGGPPDEELKNCIMHKGIEQVHFVCGTKGYSYREEDRYAFGLFNMILGSSFSSRLFQKIREKRGLCYSIASAASSYSDVGEFMISFTTSVNHLPRILEAVQGELSLVKRGDITPEELERAKNKFKGNYILAKESNEWKMVRMALQEMVYKRLVPFEETLQKVSDVTVDDLCRVIADTLRSDRFCFASIGPKGQERYLKEHRFCF